MKRFAVQSSGCCEQVAAGSGRDECKHVLGKAFFMMQF